MRIAEHQTIGTKYLRSKSDPATLQGMESKLSHRHRVITDSDLVFIRQLIAEHPKASRRKRSYAAHGTGCKPTGRYATWCAAG